MAEDSATSVPKRTPRSFAQQRLWFLDRYESGHPVFHQPLLLRLTGTLQVEVLQRALDELLSRHETLRTSFALLDDQPAVILNPAEPLCLSVLDLTSLPEARREIEALRQATEAFQQPFDLASGPLLRATLWRLGQAEHLLLTTHQMCADQQSLRNLLRELTILYAAFSQNQPAPLAPLALQYADVAQKQRERLQGEPWSRSSLIGVANLLTRHRCWSCRWTTPGQPIRVIAARGRPSPFPNT